MSTPPRKKYRQLIANLRPYIRPDFFYVNIGANDGITNDPIFPFIEKYNWHGVQVEPVPSTFKKLKINLASFKNTIFENSAVVGNKGTREQGNKGTREQGNKGTRRIYHFPYNLTEDCNLLSQISSLNIDTQNRTLEYLKNHTSPIEELETITIPIEEASKHIIESPVNCLYFEELMEKHRIKKFDFLNIDAEGLDYEIIMSIEIQKYLPSVICIETVHFDRDESKEFTKYMRENNYLRIQKFTLYSEVFVINRKI